MGAVRTEARRRAQETVAQVAKLLLAVTAADDQPHTPTADYYFIAAMGHLLGDRRDGAPITPFGRHCYVCGDHLVIARYAEAAQLKAAEQRPWASVAYIIDDMIPKAGICAELPAEYRDRLARFAAQLLPRILDLKPHIVAPRQEILSLFPGIEGSIVDPSLVNPCAEWDHFRTLADPGEPVRLAFLGTRSHEASLDLLAAVAKRLSRPPRPYRLTLFFGRHLPASIARERVIDNREPLAWPLFKQAMRRERFHMLLAPLPDTPFNRGRSITKLYDAASVGAAGLFADRPPYRGRIADGEEGLLVPDDPPAWCEAVERLAAEPGRAKTIAIQGAALAQRIGDPEILRAFWSRRLGLNQGTAEPASE